MILTPAAPALEIERGTQMIMQSGEVHELRIPKTPREGTISGYFETASALAQAAAQLDGRYPGIYITLNPVNRALLARAANRTKTRVQTTTSDADITRRRWILIDLDPVRPTGISSTHQEHGLAISVGCGVWDELRGAGWGDPVIADSGNGCHLLYPVDLPNTEDATQRIRRALQGIAARCATPEVAVDASVYNVGRITKLYGTLVCKGDSTVERPHRRSRILEIPDWLAQGKVA